jgi:putative transposase
MRLPRLKAPAHIPVAYYHCVSRIVDRRFVLGDEEKVSFLRLMRFYERFCKVRVVSYCLMSNHFHLLVEVPKRPEQQPSEAWLIGHVKRCYGNITGVALEENLKQCRAQAGEEAAQEMLTAWFSRMWDVSAFMKIVKQRFTQWFNKNSKRKGTLWEDRFRSVLVESGEALATMAAYIDLNPIRAGMVKDPADYRWSSYGAAMGGDKHARSGLQAIVATVRHDGQKQRPSPERWIEQYRVWLFGSAGEIQNPANSQVVRKGMQQAKIQAVLKAGGRVTRWEMLRCRLRYMSAGGAIGSKAFVEDLFSNERWRFDARRKEGAKPLRGGDAVWGGLRSLRSPRWAGS